MKLEDIATLAADGWWEINKSITVRDTLVIDRSTRIVGSAWLYVRDSAWLDVRDSARLYVSDSAWLDVSDSARLDVSDSARLYVRDSAWLDVRDSAWLDVRDSARLYVRDSARMYVSGSARTSPRYMGAAAFPRWPVLRRMPRTVHPRASPETLGPRGRPRLPVHDGDSAVRSEMIDLDALEALEKKLRERGVMSHEEARKLIRPLPELLRLARIGQQAERDAKETKCST